MFYYLSFGKQNSLAAFIFGLDPSKRQLGQVSMLFFIKVFLAWPVSSWDSKNVIYFHVRKLEMPKNYVLKSDVIAFTFFAIAKAFGFAKPKLNK